MHVPHSVTGLRIILMEMSLPEIELVNTWSSTLGRSFCPKNTPLAQIHCLSVLIPNILCSHCQVGTFPFRPLPNIHNVHNRIRLFQLSIPREPALRYWNLSVAAGFPICHPFALTPAVFIFQNYDLLPTSHFGKCGGFVLITFRGRLLWVGCKGKEINRHLASQFQDTLPEPMAEGIIGGKGSLSIKTESP